MNVKYGTALGLALGLITGVLIDRAVEAQNTPPAYYMGEVKVNDPDAMKPYREAVGGTVEKYGGRFLVRGGKVEPLEGAPPNGATVVIAFRNLADAQRWYNSPEYRAIVEIRQKNTTSRSWLVEGMPN